MSQMINEKVYWTSFVVHRPLLVGLCPLVVLALLVVLPLLAAFGLIVQLVLVLDSPVAILAGGAFG